ncbi:DUF5060 domain-containing protein [Enterobacter cancerogenus]|uniref:DUF5060 domain-containing protein n=1 Tax=Enterobacter cancerogenus TaxID=69218 RepID=UPI0005365F65|nr:DUF4038 domain-containing protein [Enterobacter cancerogenus]KGT88702.1 hypothetical protein NH00_19015 [Enterobacter cancerogenus]
MNVNTNFMFKVKSLSVSLIALSVMAWSASSAAAENLPTTLHKWQTGDFIFETATKNQQPFDVETTAIFTHTKSGKTYRSVLFYNGGNDFVSRVSLPESGEWRYKIESSLPDLNGRSGSVQITEANSRGKVMVDKATRKTFTYENGDVYNPQAYELDWLFSLDQKDNSLTQTKSIVDYIKQGGFNQVLMNVYAYGSSNKNSWATKDLDPKYNFNKTEIFPFLGTNDKPDYSALNVDYFKKLDEKIAHLNNQGIEAHLMIYVWNKGVNWPALGSKEELRYFNYVINRYSGFNNIIWDVSKEAMDYNHANAQFINDRIDIIRKLDPREHLVTLHDFIYAESPYLASNLDYISIQEWAPDIAKKTEDLNRLHPDKPVHNIENGCYETTTHRIFSGAFNSAEACLDRNYQIYFNGAYTTHYWQNTSWFELNYEPQKLPKEKQPNMVYQKVFSEFMGNYPLKTWKPHRFHFSTWSLINDKKEIVFYLPADADDVKGHLTPEYSMLKFKRTWLATQTGKRIDGGEWDMKGYEWIDGNKPDELIGQPAVLILTHN